MDHHGPAPFLKGLAMASGRTTALTIHLTPADRQTLLVWQWSETMPARWARRGRIILLLADRVSISDTARTVGISRRFIYKWAQRFLTAGLAGLADSPRHDARPRPVSGV